MVLIQKIEDLFNIELRKAGASKKGMEMNITFASYVGNQTGGIKSCLEACMAAKDDNGNNLYSIDKLLLSYTAATKQNAEDLEKEFKEKANFAIELFNKDNNDEEFENAIKNAEKVMFLSSGGQNFSVAETICEHYKDISYVISSDRKEVAIFNLDDNYALKTIPFSKLKTPEELIAAHPGITIEMESSPSQLNNFLKYYNITLPAGFIRNSALVNVKINGVHCDLVWNDGSNRLVLLTDFTRFDVNSKETAINLKKDLLKAVEKIVSTSQSSNNKELRQELLAVVEETVDSKNGEDILNLQRTFTQILKKYNCQSNFVKEIGKVIGNTKKVIRQDLTRIASTKEGKGLHELYDRRWYVVCANEKDIQHIKLESRGKMTPFKPYGLFKNQNGNLLFGLGPDHIKFTTQNLRRALTQLIKKDEDNELQDVTTIKIASDTLIIALGSDITATVNATIAHRKNNKIKNVIIVATVNDSEIQELADNTKDYFEKIGLHTQILPTDINGSNILKSLVKESSATNVNVNITPGSKGQTASLSYWAAKNEALIWSILTRTAQLKCISDKSKDSEEFLVEACDIKDYLKILYPYADLFRDDTEDEKKFMSLLLKQMKACLNENKKWVQVWDEKFKFSAGGITLSFRRSRDDTHYSSNKGSNSGTFILKDENKNVFTYEVDGGDWFESLTSQALREAGCHYAYARTRLPFEEKLQEKLEKNYQDVFRLDMDSIASWHGVHVMVSCKAQELGSHNATPLDRVAVEAQDVTASLNRFAIPVVCYLYKGDTSQFISEEDNKKKTIPVIDWKDLCQSEKLREILENARLNKSTNQSNTNNQTA